MILVAAITGPSIRPQPTALLDDATIVAIFDAANQYDVETGTLGSNNGATTTVRRVGEALVRDHKSVLQQGRDLANRLGVTPTPPAENPLAAQHAAILRDLRGKTGAAFDQAFLDHEIAYHQAVIDAINQTFLPAIKNQELKAFVVKVVPAFQAHLDMCKAARQAIQDR